MAHARTRDDQPATVALAPKGRRATSDAPAGGEGGWSGQDEKPAADDDWLPVNARRNTKWCAWLVAFLPPFRPITEFSIPRGVGVTVLVLSWVIMVYTLWQMVEMHECVPGKRFDRYHELGRHAFSEKLGLWIVVSQQLVVEVGLNIVYMITGGQSLQKFHDVLPDFHSISSVSLAADVMSVGYSAIAWTASAAQGKAAEADVDYSLRATTTPGKVFGFLGTLGEVAFTYAGHNVVLEIQATIPSTPGKPSKKPMWKGVIVAYVVIAACYLPVALVGYWAFGNDVDENILITLNRPRWLIVAANMMVVVHVVGSYQVYAMPVFDMIETVLVKTYWFTPGFRLCLIAWTVYIALTMFMAITFPFFSELLSFFGGFAYAPTSYFLPCIMWLIIYKPRRFSLSWLTNWICIVIGVLLMVLSPIGGLRQMILKIKTYKFYQDYSGLSHN
ncbi:Lysine histidine transporter 2 [Zea mays]|uniref:Lysine histidine transporter 2 n=1 Tax=Zea mays TaxID=4577 RepID=A0A1D6KM78_MAIZE|nr:Lysine histidine transporter 2 [Zea mays]